MVIFYFSIFLHSLIEILFWGNVSTTIYSTIYISHDLWKFILWVKIYHCLSFLLIKLFHLWPLDLLVLLPCVVLINLYFWALPCYLDPRLPLGAYISHYSSPETTSLRNLWFLYWTKVIRNSECILNSLAGLWNQWRSIESEFLKMQPRYQNF